MDKVLKRRLIGASILIALAVIFVPMLLVDPDSVRDDFGNSPDVPPMPESAREVRRIPLDPEASRVGRPPETALQREDPESSRVSGSEPASGVADADNRVNPDDEIVLRPDLNASEPPAPELADDASAAESDVRPSDSNVDSNGDSETATESPAPDEPAAGPASESAPEQQAGREPVSMGNWIVQVASFGSQDAANQVRRRLEALGHIVARDEIVRGQSMLYRLRTGPYPSRAAAEHALAQISATVEGVDPIVRKIDKDFQEGLETGFAVQVGSFVSDDNAKNETARLADLGFESFRFSEQIGERLIWRVMVGPVAERDEADALKSRLVEQADVEGLVVSYP